MLPDVALGYTLVNLLFLFHLCFFYGILYRNHVVILAYSVNSNKYLFYFLETIKLAKLNFMCSLRIDMYRFEIDPPLRELLILLLGSIQQ